MTDIARSIAASVRAAKLEERATHAEPGPEREHLRIQAEVARKVQRGILDRAARGETDG